MGGGFAALQDGEERRGEDVRWQRERQDRREEDRRQQYANLIAILDYWQSALESLRTNVLYAEATGPELEPDDIPMNELWRHRDAARQALAVVDLIAPPKVRSLGRRAVEAGEMLNVNVTSHRAEGVSNDFREGRIALSEAMREDLGLQATAEVAEKRNQRLSANQCPFPRHGPIAAAVVAELVDQVRRALARRALRAAQLAAARPGGASGRPAQPCQGPGWLTVGTAGLHVRTRPHTPAWGLRGAVPVVTTRGCDMA